MLDKALITVFCVFLLIGFTLFTFDLTLTTIKKINFDNLCRNALYRMDLAGGMTAEIKTELIEGLEEGGFEKIIIFGPAYIQYSQKIDFIVNAESKETISGFWSEAIGRKSFSFKQSLISRKIHNNAY